MSTFLNTPTRTRVFLQIKKSTRTRTQVLLQKTKCTRTRTRVLLKVLILVLKYNKVLINNSG